jgi:hypothetical protein
VFMPAPTPPTSVQPTGRETAMLGSQSTKGAASAGTPPTAPTRYSLLPIAGTPGGGCPDPVRIADCRQSQPAVRAPWLDSSQVRRVHGGGADRAGPARLLGRWDHYPEGTDRLGRSEEVTFTGGHVGRWERRPDGLVRSDSGLPIQGGSGAFSPSSSPYAP